MLIHVAGAATLMRRVIGRTRPVGSEEKLHVAGWFDGIRASSPVCSLSDQENVFGRSADPVDCQCKCYLLKI
jgi:hypothetical protein